MIEDWKIPLYKIYTDDEDINLITKIVKRGTHWAIGSEIEEFEKAISNDIKSAKKIIEICRKNKINL